MRIATWPVNGINRRIRYLVHWLDSRKPDIVALQKIHGSAESFPAKELNSVGYCAVPFPPSVNNDFGVAILIRRPSFQAKMLQPGLPGRQHDGARLLTIEVGELIISSIYVPAKKQRRIAWLHDLTKYVDSQLDATKRVVLCGDFNVNEKAATRDERRQLELLSDIGYNDLYYRLHPHGDGFNFGNNPSKPVTSRLNRILGTRHIAEAVRCVWVDLKYRGPILGMNDRDWTKSAPLIADLR